MASLLSSIPFLDLIDSCIVLAAEVVAIIYLREEAHSAFWFMLLLTIMPPVTAIVGGIAACTPCKWDDLVISIGTAVMMNVCFAYFCSDELIDPVTGEQLMGFGYLPDIVLDVAAALVVENDHARRVAAVRRGGERVGVCALERAASQRQQREASDADDHRGVRTVERAASKRQQREASDAVVGEVGRNTF